MKMNDIIKEANSCPIPTIFENSYWSMDDVRTLCIRQKWCTRATNEDYEIFLRFVGVSNPSKHNLYLASKFIKQHTDDDMLLLSDIMYYLMANTVHTTFEIMGEDDE